MATVGELSKRYSSQLSQLQAIFPSWSDSDLVFALQDVKGNVEEAVLAISEGESRDHSSIKAPRNTTTTAMLTRMLVYCDVACT